MDCATWDWTPLTDGNIQNEEHLGNYVFYVGFLFLFSVLALIYFYFLNISPIHPLLLPSTSTTLVQDTVIFYLDNYNSFLAGPPTSSLAIFLSSFSSTTKVCFEWMTLGSSRYKFGHASQLCEWNPAALSIKLKIHNGLLPVWLAVTCLSVLISSHSPSAFILQLFKHSIVPSATKAFVNNVLSIWNGCYVPAPCLFSPMFA